ncbi:MAG: hypothetical protein KDD53_07875, partial [Bdellovibrionales bacterium]|nr:hypothetical protein [Bdellovibrionales bacterium]
MTHMFMLIFLGTPRSYTYQKQPQLKSLERILGGAHLYRASREPEGEYRGNEQLHNSIRDYKVINTAGHRLNESNV